MGKKSRLECYECGNTFGWWDEEGTTLYIGPKNDPVFTVVKPERLRIECLACRHVLEVVTFTDEKSEDKVD